VLKTLEEEVSREAIKTAEKAVDQNTPIIVDVRTPHEFLSGAYPGAVNIELDELMERYGELGNSKSRDIVVYCASGARSAYAQRMLAQIGYTNVSNGGGIAAMMAQRNSRAAAPVISNEPIIVDVRSTGEFSGGAYPGAINIPVDELQHRISELGGKSREITLYCASGARSGYGQRVLHQLGFTNVKNGGGIMQMMMRR
jgi:rhodanese-related sulfurtransferase